MRGVLVRFLSSRNQTLGMLDLYDVGALQSCFTCYILEPAWLMNKRGVSCIPPGRYTVKKRRSKKFGEHFIIEGVANRDYILIHPGNYRHDTSGCLLVGSSVEDLDGDGLEDVTNSRKTMRRLNRIAPDEWTLDIIDPV